MILTHTNRSESKHFLESEIIEYSSVAMSKSHDFDWNSIDKKRISEMSLMVLKKIKDKKYADVMFTDKEAEKIVSETIDDLIV